jgi:8-oxo-dGTP diphosphatase
MCLGATGRALPLYGQPTGYHAIMVGYVKGTDVEAEVKAIREGLARIGAAMQSDPDAARAFSYATTLERLGSEISEEASGFRAWFAAALEDERRVPRAEVAELLGLSYGRVGQLVRAGRQRKGNPIVDPGTQPLQLPVVLAVITGPRGVLICHRIDERPPWSFPGGEFSTYDEAPASAAVRRVPLETGLEVEVRAVLGDRIHPRTGRRMVYLACSAVDDEAEPRIVEEESDLDAVRWAGLDFARNNMPDMYPPVRAHLEAVLSSINQF